MSEPGSQPHPPRALMLLLVEAVVVFLGFLGAGGLGSLCAEGGAGQCDGGGTALLVLAAVPVLVFGAWLIARDFEHPRVFTIAAAVSIALSLGALTNVALIAS